MPETLFNLVLFFDTEELVGQTDHAFYGVIGKKGFYIWYFLRATSMTR